MSGTHRADTDSAGLRRNFAALSHSAKEPVWFAFDDSRPVAFFAGIWAPQWESVRKIREGMITTDLFAFLTTGPNEEVGAIHPKAMPAILTTPEEVETWMTAQWDEAKKL